MLRVYALVLELITELRTLVSVIERKERDLERQLRRASASVALNLAEGMYSRGKNRAARYHNALGSARETWACLEVAVAAGYIRKLEPALTARIHRIVGTLVRLVERAAQSRASLRDVRQGGPSRVAHTTRSDASAPSASAPSSLMQTSRAPSVHAALPKHAALRRS